MLDPPDARETGLAAARSAGGHEGRHPVQRHVRLDTGIRRAALPATPPALELLGGFRLRVAGVEVALSSGTQRMVALLALRGRMSRSRVAGTLWPETTEHRALASLRTSLWRVSQAAPNLVRGDGGSVDLEDDVCVDSRDLVRVAVAFMRSRSVPDGAWAHLGEDGELLPGWDEEWLLPDRERLRQLRLHVLEKLAERLAAERRFGLALDAALAALRADRLRESAHRSVIQIHLAEGNVGEARRAFDTCRELLGRELGVEPSFATRRMLQREQAGDSPSVGRAAVMAQRHRQGQRAV